MAYSLAIPSMSVPIHPCSSLFISVHPCPSMLVRVRPCLSMLVRVRPSHALIEPPKKPISQDPHSEPLYSTDPSRPMQRSATSAPSQGGSISTCPSPEKIYSPLILPGAPLVQAWSVYFVVTGRMSRAGDWALYR